MTVAGSVVWRPFDDGPLFVPELLHGPAAVPGGLRDLIVSYLTQVTEARGLPLHTCTAFNVLHFGFDIETRGYSADVLAPELFVRVAADHQRPVLPAGTFVHLDRGGRRSLLAEVVARYGADPAIDDDGWTPPALSGAPPGQHDASGGRTAVERVILDVEAFGAPLSASDYTELDRLRRHQILDEHGHLTGPVHYPPGADVDDVALYTAHLLGPARPLLLGGPLGSLLTEPVDQQLLTAGLRQAFDTIDHVLTTAPSLRRWHGYAISRAEFDRRHRRGWSGLGTADVEDVAATVRRSGPQPRYTGIWPLLDGQAHSGDALDGAAAAGAVVHTNLVVADLTAAAVDGLLAGGTHLRVDDVWQAGGVWRAQRQPVPADILATDPLQPLGLGHQTAAETVTAGGPDDGTPDRDVPADEQLNTEPHGDMSDLVVTDTLVVYTVALRERHWTGGLLPLATQAATVLGDGPLWMQLDHDGDTLDDDELMHQISRDNTGLTGINWPWTFYPGIKVTVAVARNATRISATTTLLDEPLPFGAQYRWDANTAILAAALGAEQPPPPPPTEPDEPMPAGVPRWRRGVTQLRGLIIAALRRHGTPGAFEARRLTGCQLLAALFGPELIAPELMREIVYTCERLVDAGLLTREPGPVTAPGATGPDVFVWWPDDAARRRAQQQVPENRTRMLTGRIREHWVPPFARRLPEGQQASDEAKAAYAVWMAQVHGPDADAELPAGWTFVRGQLRGTGSPGGLLSLARSSYHQPA
jgi:hypothetical protein